MISDPAEAVVQRRCGDGEPLVLVHGLGLHWRLWKPVLPALEERHDVLALDLPGFGEAPPLRPDVTPTVPTLADTVERAMEQAGIHTAHLAGNSMGGWIALELARRDRARTVTAISPAGRYSAREAAYAWGMLRATRLMTRALAPAAARLTRSPAARKALLSWLVLAKPKNLDPREAAYTVRAYARSAAFPAACDWLFSHQAIGLEEIRCPVLIAWGTKDRLLLPRQGPRFAASIPGAELKSLAGLGHTPMADDPETISRLILERTRPRRQSPPRPTTEGVR